mgnify:CR=1 FL=1
MGLVSNIINDEKGTFYSDEKGTKKNDVDNFLGEPRYW